MKGVRYIKKKQNKVKRFFKRNGLFLLVFIIGFSILLYPQVSNWYYTIESNNKVAEFDAGKEKLTNEDVEKRMALARAFNETLHDVTLEDPYSESERKAGKAEYARMLEINEQMGYVDVPTANIKLPIYAGTSEEVISKGVGHLEGTSLPVGGINTHTVLTSHAGLPSAKLFTELSQVKVGDVFYVHNVKEILAYKVDSIKTIEPHDFSNLLVEEGQDYATLLTCTPIGVNTHRLIVRGHRIPYVAEEAQAAEAGSNCIIYIAIGIISLVGLIVFLLLRRKKRKKDEAKKQEK